MFKTIILYRCEGDMPDSAADLAEAMEAHTFVELGATQSGTGGWAPPRDEHGALVEAIGGQWILKLQTEARAVPAGFVKRELKKRLDKVEEETGRRPRGKMAKEIKELLIHELMPRAFPKEAGMLVWIDPATKLVAIEASTAKKADLAVLLLAAALPKSNITQVQTLTSPAMAMSAWLHDGEAPADWSIDRDGALEGLDDTRSMTLSGIELLEGEDIRERLRQGMAVTRLAMTYKGRVSLTLTDKLYLKGIAVLDVAMEAHTAEGKANDAFDADVAIVTGELRPLIAALLGELGGVSVLPIVAAAEGKEVPAGEPMPHNGEGPDPLYEQAVAIVKAKKRASISLVQRHLRIGYNRAARLIEAMEFDGHVGPMDAGGKREILDGAFA